MELPTCKQIASGVVVDMNKLTDHERRLINKKKSYLKNKEKILASMKEKYSVKREALIAEGMIPRQRGRPRKYPLDSEILGERETPA